MALRLWLAEVKDIVGEAVSVSSVPCATNVWDLIVDTSEYGDKSHVHMPTFHGFIEYRGRKVDAIAINTAFNGIGLDGLYYSVLDFVKAAHGMTDLAELLNSVSTGPSRSNLEDFANATKNSFDVSPGLVSRK
jgi:hypothetical protein